MNVKVLDAMRLIVSWRTMTDMCYQRSSCKGCEYNKTKSCDLVSTEEVMINASNVFYEYLAEHNPMEIMKELKDPS